MGHPWAPIPDIPSTLRLADVEIGRNASKLFLVITLRSALFAQNITVSAGYKTVDWRIIGVAVHS